MKKVIPILLIFLASCSGNPLELNKAKAVSEDLIITIKDERFDNFADHYTKDFFQEITDKQWIEDLKKVKELLGPIESYQLTETNIENNIGEESDIVLVYDIQHSKFKSHFILTIVIEDGKHKVRGHRIKSDAL